MTTTPTMQHRLKHHRPSLRRNARPPKQRSQLGAAFTAANLGCALALQYCRSCDSVQYPPRELCQHCLADGLVWREADTRGHIINRLDLHHSLWEYFKRRIAEAPWPVATVRLDCGATVFTHLALASFGAASAADVPASSAVQVFTHTDCSLNSVLIAVSAGAAIATPAQRRELAAALGLLEPAHKPEGI